MKTNLIAGIGVAAMVALTGPADATSAKTHFEKTYANVYECKVAAIDSIAAAAWTNRAVEIVVEGASWAAMVPFNSEGKVYLFTCTKGILKLQEVS